MQICYVIGDLIDGPDTLIVHGCNARGRYQSGMAKAMRERLPFAYEAYDAAFNDFSAPFEVGQVVWGITTKTGVRPRIVGNMITQEDYGRDPNRVYVNYDAVLSCLRVLNRFVQQTQTGEIAIAQIGAIERVGFPLIGAGLGNGSWAKISRMIEGESHVYVPVVYTLDGSVPQT